MRADKFSTVRLGMFFLYFPSLKNIFKRTIFTQGNETNNFHVEVSLIFSYYPVVIYLIEWH